MTRKAKWLYFWAVLPVVIVLVGLLLALRRSRVAEQARIALQAVAANTYGVGMCHSVPSAKPHDDVTWGYGTTPAFWWGWLEPTKGQFDFSLLDLWVDVRVDSGIAAWFSVQTGGIGISGERKAPMWLFDEGAVWISGTCAKDGMIPPWDEVYRERLPILLAAVNAHIAEWDEAHRSIVAGIIAASGGMYGEMQVSSCGAKEAMKTHYGVNDVQFNALYGDAIAELADTYFAAFPDMDIMWQVGYSVTEADAALEQDVVAYLEMLYSDRLFIKWAGLDPVNGLDWQRRANQHYQVMFKSLAARGVRVGYEPKHPDNYQTPVGSGTWDAAKFEEVFGWALGGGASFMCFQRELLSGLFEVPGWQAFDAALEANAQGTQATPTPTATLPAVTTRKGGVAWPGAPVALADDIAALGARAVHHWNYNEARLVLMEALGVEYLPVQWGCGTTSNSWDTIDLVAIGQFARDHPGLRWLIFNEPDRDDQANCPPALAAEVYHDIYNTLKQADPTSSVYCCGTSDFEAHRQWLWNFFQEYSDRYLAANGGLPPMDGVHLHFYGEYDRRFGYMEMQRIIQETRELTWEGIGGSDAWAELPMIISEWGVLSDRRDSPFEEDKVAAYLRNMWEWLESPNQDWITDYFWYPTWVGANQADSGNLFTSRTDGTLTLVGRMWRDMARATPLPTPSPTSPISPLPTPTKTPTIIPSPTFTPIATSTPTPTRTATVTLTPSLTPTATATITPSSTRTPTSTPSVTATPATPAPLDCWIVIGDQRYRFDCWKEGK